MDNIEKLNSLPRIGLALGGGGVRGMAHVGVLSVLEEEKIPVAAIAGSSIGAIVGTTYALNPQFDKNVLINKVLKLSFGISKGFEIATKKKGSFLDRLREFVNVERFLVDTVWGWGILAENEIADLLSELSGGKNLEESHIPVAVVSADLSTGDRIILTRGPANVAMKASSAIPGIIPPVRQGEMLLGDGATVDVVPAEVVRQMNTDIVVAVDVDQEEVKIEVRNGLEAFLRAFEICSRHHKRHHLKMADLVIRPHFTEPVQTFDVSKCRMCVDAGIEAAREAIPLIKKLISKNSFKPGSKSIHDERR